MGDPVGWQAQDLRLVQLKPAMNDKEFLQNLNRIAQTKEAAGGARLAGLARSRAKAKWGSSMTLLGPELRVAVVAHEYVLLMAGQEAIEPNGQAERLIDGASEIAKG